MSLYLDPLVNWQNKAFLDFWEIEGFQRTNTKKFIRRKNERIQVLAGSNLSVKVLVILKNRKINSFCEWDGINYHNLIMND